MKMGMMDQGLSPAVEYGEETDLGAQMFGIGSDGGQGLGCGSKQNAVNEILVLVSDGSDLFGDRENDVEIMRLEDFGCSFFNPRGTCEGLAFWTVAVTTGVVARPFVNTGVAASKH
jgi:hypothetical protein